MWVVHISEGNKLYIVNLWSVYIIITALNTKITLKQICPTLRINVLKSMCECSNLWLTLNIPTCSSSWTANVAPQGNRPKFLLYSFCSIADYLFRWWRVWSLPSWRSPALWAKCTTCSFLQLEQIKVYLKYISAPKTAQIHMEQIIHSYTVQ